MSELKIIACRYRKYNSIFMYPKYLIWLTITVITSWNVKMLAFSCVSVFAIKPLQLSTPTHRTNGYYIESLLIPFVHFLFKIDLNQNIIC